MSENALEGFASTGVNTPEAMFPNCAGGSTALKTTSGPCRREAILALNFRVACENEAARAADATACIDSSAGAARLKNGWRGR